MAFTASETAELKAAKKALENPGLVGKISNRVGTPIESALKKLPAPLNHSINAAVRKSVEKALDVALSTMNLKDGGSSSNWHRLAVGATGALGGAFGLAGLVVELPLATTIIFRSIAEIARSQGEDLQSPDARLQCLQVLAMGGKSASDDGAETGYFAARAALAKAVSEASRHLAQKGALQSGAPALVRLIAQIAGRFSIVVSEKAAAQAIPLVGALGGAAINSLFISHFQEMARGHFTIRRLERLHGQEVVRRLYESL